MKNSRYKKTLVLGIIVLFIGMSITPSTGTTLKQKSIKSISDGNILYVGGSGPNNYTRIKDALYDAVDGDTIFVYEGYYKEHFIIDKSINLIGENKEKTIIDGDGYNEVIYVEKDNVTIKSFTIENNIWTGDFGIYVRSNNNTIIDNIISSDDWAISFSICNSNTIIGNIFKNTEVGIDLQSGNSIVLNNIFYNCGIHLLNRTQKIVSNNTVNGKPLIYLENESDIIISDNAGQLILVDCDNITIQKQHLNNTTIGLQLWYTNNCSVLDNDMSNNNCEGLYFFQSSNNTISKNKIESNRLGGIFFQEFSNNNTFKDNSINSNSYNGIYGMVSRRNSFINNIISDNKAGIYLTSGHNNIIGNIITENEYGLQTSGSNYNNIEGNIISDNNRGIYLQFSSFNTIISNEINSNSDKAITLCDFSQSNNIISNNISKNFHGIHIVMSSKNSIIKNNFIENQRYADFELRKEDKNTWNQNFWNRFRIFPKLIFGKIHIEYHLLLPWIQIDWHPAKKPYDIYSKVEDAIVTAHGISGQIKLILVKGGQNYGAGYDPSDVNIFIEGHKVTPVETWVVGGEILLGQDATGNWTVGETCPPGDYSVTVSIMDTVVYNGVVTVT